MPVTFRVNAGEVNFDAVSKMLNDKNFISGYIKAAAQSEENPDEEIDILTCLAGALADLSFNEMSIHY